MWVFLLLLLWIFFFFFFDFVHLLHTQPSSLSLYCAWMNLNQTSLCLAQMAFYGESIWVAWKEGTRPTEKAATTFQFVVKKHATILNYLSVFFFNSYAHFSVLNYKYNVRNITKYHNNFTIFLNYYTKKIKLDIDMRLYVSWYTNLKILWNC